MKCEIVKECRKKMSKKHSAKKANRMPCEVCWRETCVCWAYVCREFRNEGQCPRGEACPCEHSEGEPIASTVAESAERNAERDARWGQRRVENAQEKRAKKHTAKKANRMPKEGSQLVYSRPAGRSSSAPAWSR